MVHTAAQESIPANRIQGLKIARVVGFISGLIMLYLAMDAGFRFFNEGYYFPTALKMVFFCVYGALLMAPWFKLKDSDAWLRLFIALTVSSMVFIFITIFTVMFTYIELMERGEKLGVPGLEGTLIFMTLMQVPVVLFIKKPHLLD